VDDENIREASVNRACHKGRLSFSPLGATPVLSLNSFFSVSRFLLTKNSHFINRLFPETRQIGFQVIKPSPYYPESTEIPNTERLKRDRHCVILPLILLSLKYVSLWRERLPQDRKKWQDR